MCQNVLKCVTCVVRNDSNDTNMIIIFTIVFNLYIKKWSNTCFFRKNEK